MKFVVLCEVDVMKGVDVLIVWWQAASQNLYIMLCLTPVLIVLVCTVYHGDPVVTVASGRCYSPCSEAADLPKQPQAIPHELVSAAGKGKHR